MSSCGGPRWPHSVSPKCTSLAVAIVASSSPRRPRERAEPGRQRSVGLDARRRQARTRCRARARRYATTWRGPTVSTSWSPARVVATRAGVADVNVTIASSQPTLNSSALRDGSRSGARPTADTAREPPRTALEPSRARALSRVPRTHSCSVSSGPAPPPRRACTADTAARIAATSSSVASAFTTRRIGRVGHGGRARAACSRACAAAAAHAWSAAC